MFGKRALSLFQGRLIVYRFSKRLGEDSISFIAVFSSREQAIFRHTGEVLCLNSESLEFMDPFEVEGFHKVERTDVRCQNL